jgi:hypothetical protein
VSELSKKKINLIDDLLNCRIELSAKTFRDAKDAQSTINQLFNAVSELNDLHSSGPLAKLMSNLLTDLTLIQKQGEVALIGLNTMFVA